MAASKVLSFLFLFSICIKAQASLEVGAGSTSATGGRIVPALALGVSNSSWGVFASSTGVANQYYFQSNYQLSYYWIHNSGTMWGGVVSPGFGLGTMYTLRSFKDEGSTVELKSDDFALGPALRLHWIYFDSIYIGLDAMWGIRNMANIVGLAYQDYACLSFGMKLW